MSALADYLLEHHFNAVHHRPNAIYPEDDVKLSALEVIKSQDASLSAAQKLAEDAIELAEETVGYAGEYFQYKWHLNERLAELKAIKETA